MQSEKKSLQPHQVYNGRTSGIAPKKMMSVVSVDSMRPLLEGIAEANGGALRISAGGQDLFVSKLYMALTESGVSLSRRTIPMRFEECEGLCEVLFPEDRSNISRLAQLAFQGEVLAGIVHDANNALTSIRGNMCCLEATASREGLTDIDEILKDLDVGLESIEGVLRRANLCLSKKSEIIDINVLDIVESSLFLVRDYFRRIRVRDNKKISISVHVPRGLTAWGVGDDVQMALVNILMNAAKHGIQEEGRIIILAEVQEGKVVIEVWNDGLPIPEEIRDSLLNESLSECCDAGIGMFTSAKNIRRFGGDISFETDPQWTVFYVSLPTFDKYG